MKQLEVKNNKVRCPIDGSYIHIHLCIGCSKCKNEQVDNDTKAIVCEFAD